MRYRCFLLSFILYLPLFSQTKTFIREYTYIAGDADSKITSRSIALDQVKRILLEEIGVYLQSTVETSQEEKNSVYNALTREQTQSITAGITQTQILDEKWNGQQYYIKASITVNPEEVLKEIANIASDQNKLKELDDVRLKADQALAQIEALRKQLIKDSTENGRLNTQQEYITATNSLSATDWIERGYSTYEMQDTINAIICFQNAIELAPNNPYAQNNLGVIYYDKGSFDKAIPLFGKAVELKSNFSAGYCNLANTYRAKGNTNKAIALYEKAIEIDPENSEAYCGLGNSYQAKEDIQKRINYYKKAAALGHIECQKWLQRNGYTW